LTNGDFRVPSRTVESDHRTLTPSPEPVSQPVKVQVAVDVFHAVVPVEDQVALLDRPQPGHTELHHRMEVPKEDVVNERTYFLPVGTCLGLTSAFLK
jgi:hypothetical protein